MVRRLFPDENSALTDLRCVWCDRVTGRGEMELFQGAVSVCPCGAMVLLASPQDFDEAGQELLDALSIEGQVEEPAVPVGRSGMVTMRRYDGAASRRKLAELLTATGCETLPEELEVAYPSPGSPARIVMTRWALWWRPRPQTAPAR